MCAGPFDKLGLPFATLNRVLVRTSEDVVRLLTDVAHVLSQMIGSTVGARCQSGEPDASRTQVSDGEATELQARGQWEIRATGSR